MFYSAVVAAAGLSSRMKAFKPLLPLADGTVIGAVITTLKRAGVDDIVVVTGYKADEMAVHLEKHEVRIVENKLYAESEMFDSIKLGPGVFSRPKNSTSSTSSLYLFNIIREFKTYQSTHSEMKRYACFDMMKLT